VQLAEIRKRVQSLLAEVAEHRAANENILASIFTSQWRSTPSGNENSGCNKSSMNSACLRKESFD
jgi:hypothetical protein